jgi:uncharacterized membrane protein required for colicin V production
MISILWIFIYMIIFFGLIGSIRGWQLEVIATTGLIAAIAALTQFGSQFIPPLVQATMFIWGTEPDPATAADRGAIMIQSFFLCSIAFFSYQVVSRITQNIGSGRFGDKLREGFQKRFIGFVLGLVNGYLLFGSLWGFLEYIPTPGVGYVLRPIGTPYPFNTETIIRPAVGSAAAEWVAFLPIGWISPTVWLLLFFLFFFIIIIALI